MGNKSIPYRFEDVISLYIFASTDSRFAQRQNAICILGNLLLARGRGDHAKLPAKARSKYI